MKFDLNEPVFDEAFINSDKRAVAYVDGSFNPALEKYAFGAVLFAPSGMADLMYGCNNNPDALAQRNVSGEMIAAMRAVRWAIGGGYSSIDLRYDYQGIESWVTGAWKAKNDLTKKYAASMREWGKQISISFTKVAAHTNDTYNELADQLAKEGLMQEAGSVKMISAIEAK